MDETQNQLIYNHHCEKCGHIWSSAGQASNCPICNHWQVDLVPGNSINHIGDLYEGKLYPVRAEVLVGLDRVLVKYEQ